MSNSPEISVHDNHLISYTVFSDTAEIHIHTRFTEREPHEFTDIIVTGVIAYHFQNDCFGTIIFDIKEADAWELYLENRDKFEAGRSYGWPGPWNSSDDAVLTYLENHAIRAFFLTPTVGMSGWILAKELELRPNVCE